MIYLPPLLPGLVALIALLLPEPAARRRGMAGALLTALALASLTVAGGGEWRAAELPASYLGIDAALLLLGLLIPLLVAVRLFRDGRWPPTVILATGITLIAGFAFAAPMAVAGGGATPLALASLVAGAAFLRYVAPRIAAGARWLDALLFPARRPPDPLRDARSRTLLVTSAAAALVALFAPRLDLLLGAVLAGLIAGVLLDRHLTRRWPVAVPLAGLDLLVLSYLLIHVAGDTPLTLTAMGEAPYSDAFQVLAALLLGTTSWVLLGLWPFASAPRGVHAPLFAAALLVRVLGPILPDGAAHWQPLFYLLPVIGAWHGAATGRPREALRALALLGLLAGTDSARWAGIGLVLAAIIADGAVLLPAPRREHPAWRLLLSGTALAGALLLRPLLEGALAAQTVYTVLTVLGAALSLFGARAVEVALTPSGDATILRPGHSAS